MKHTVSSTVSGIVESYSEPQIFNLMKPQLRINRHSNMKNETQSHIPYNLWKN